MMFKTLLITLKDMKKCRLFTHSEGISNILEAQDIKMSSDIYEPLQALHRREHLGAAFLCFLTGMHITACVFHSATLYSTVMTTC